eukprot:CAMPEP_0176448910 /NCGR_PEP_ID=MMETSP0127-20121128/26117_1 /TAXON_ID=938130 /ORGANISM="Platyophrya macrostoma, Strain WH" /LENGTH=103 /DNA_ID=CAMNT_0017836055 /DNA_START=65 /DNA_END=376 /DNA_ORIENTATION=+
MRSITTTLQIMLKESEPESEEARKEAKRELKSLKNEFGVWKDFTEKKIEARDKKKNAGRYTYAALWEEKNKPTKMGMLAKKRAAIRKQMFLKDKAEYLKGMRK